MSGVLETMLSRFLLRPRPKADNIVAAGKAGNTQGLQKLLDEGLPVDAKATVSI